MRVLVTGGAGFIGSHVVEAALAAGHEVAVIDNLSSGHREWIPPQAAFYHCDITTPVLASVVAQVQPEVVVHHAAQVSVPRSVRDPLPDAQLNILGTVAVLEAARNSGVRKVILAGSAAVYGNPVYLPVDEAHPIAPLSPYGLSKHTAERYIALYSQLYGLHGTVLRYANVYGPRQDAQGEAGVVTLFATALSEGRPATIFGGGDQTRDFVYVEDVARANVMALERGDGLTINIGSGQPTTIRHLWSLMAGLVGEPVGPITAPDRPGDIAHSWFSIQRAGAALGWTPSVDMATGLARTLEFFKK